jgi:hypothetical protein
MKQMSLIDNGEELLPLETIRRKHIPKTRNGNCVSRSTLYRWISKGIRGVALETVHCGGMPMSSIAAVNRFILAVTASQQQARIRRQTQGAIECADITALTAAGLVSKTLTAAFQPPAQQ